MRIFKRYIGVLAVAVLMMVGLSSANAATCSSVTYKSGSGAANDIVFTFDKTYTCGQFANGDFWVTASPGTTVTIKSITPAAANGMHGFEVNPSSQTAHGLDFRIPGYNAALTPSLPLVLSGNVSVVKAVSVPYDPLVKTCAAANRPCLQHAAVLTVTAAPVSNSATVFRPGYYGKTKTFYSTAKIGSKYLGKFPATCCSEAANLTFDTIKARYQRVQLDHIAGWIGRDAHPLDNMPDYGAVIAGDSGVSLLRMLMTDFYPTNTAHKAAMVNYLQMAVDLQSMAINGAAWMPDGGHSNGRKLPLMFAGWYLDEPSFQAAINASKFSEDLQVYYSPRANAALFGRDCGTDPYRYWSTTIKGSGTRDCRDPYGQIDGGGKEIGAAYQFCCTAKPWKYTALVIKALGLQMQWNYPPFFQYVDRYVKAGVKALPDTCAAYDGVASNYSKTYGSPTLTSDCVAGKARWPAVNATNIDAGQYGHPLGEQMWAYWAKSHP